VPSVRLLYEDSPGPPSTTLPILYVDSVHVQILLPRFPVLTSPSSEIWKARLAADEVALRDEVVVLKELG
jgi:hypothetical protein